MTLLCPLQLLHMTFDLTNFVSVLHVDPLGAKDVSLALSGFFMFVSWLAHRRDLEFACFKVFLQHG